MEDRIGQSVRSAPDREPKADVVRTPANPVLLDRSFGQDDITVLRHEVTSRLVSLDLSADRRHGYVLAVNEVITNVVLHAGGNGRLVLRVEDGSVWCVVTDSGPGIPGGYLDTPQAPEAFEVGGRGLWLAHQLCDEVTTATGPIGTSIGLRLSLGATPDS
ncbi:ATP-binding protein [Actinoplanes sp. DH11]|uniref:ATP-binding protein n=1 Tax=Actinoplanes sp. DH11 TaxID=2857011 RepID=UPI001E536D7A|nr:ATP-binding protein [Actinoplanes sp. DH11]